MFRALWPLYLGVPAVLFVGFVLLRLLDRGHAAAVRRSLCALLDDWFAEISGPEALPLQDLAIREDIDPRGHPRRTYEAVLPTRTTLTITCTIRGKRREYAMFRVVWGYPDDAAPLEFPREGASVQPAWFIRRMKAFRALFDAYPLDQLMSRRMARVVRVIGGEPA